MAPLTKNVIIPGKLAPNSDLRVSKQNDRKFERHLHLKKGKILAQLQVLFPLTSLTEVISLI